MWQFELREFWLQERENPLREMLLFWKSVSLKHMSTGCLRNQAPVAIQCAWFLWTRAGYVLKSVIASEKCVHGVLFLKGFWLRSWGHFSPSICLPFDFLSRHWLPDLFLMCAREWHREAWNLVLSEVGLNSHFCCSQTLWLLERVFIL